MADNVLLRLTANIVAAHVANNPVATNAVPELISVVHGALSTLGTPTEQPAAVPTPAVPIQSSVKPDYIVCLEDGAKLKMLKRYLKAKFDLTPDQYRTKWGLPHNYPMITANYAETRRTLAKVIGFGRKPKEVFEEAAAPIAKSARSALVIAARNAETPAPRMTMSGAAAKSARKPGANKA